MRQGVLNIMTSKIQELYHSYKGWHFLQYMGGLDIASIAYWHNISFILEVSKSTVNKKKDTHLPQLK